MFHPDTQITVFIPDHSDTILDYKHKQQLEDWLNEMLEAHPLIFVNVEYPNHIISFQLGTPAQGYTMVTRYAFDSIDKQQYTEVNKALLAFLASIDEY